MCPESYHPGRHHHIVCNFAHGRQEDHTLDHLVQRSSRHGGQQGNAATHGLACRGHFVSRERDIGDLYVLPLTDKEDWRAFVSAELLPQVMDKVALVVNQVVVVRHVHSQTWKITAKRCLSRKGCK